MFRAKTPKREDEKRIDIRQGVRALRKRRRVRENCLVSEVEKISKTECLANLTQTFAKAAIKT